MRAQARLATEADPRSGQRVHSRLHTLRSDWPLMLRTTLADTQGAAACWAGQDAAPAHVHLTAAGAGPVGGDQLHLQVRVGAGSALVFGEVSPTLLLPGPHGEQSRLDVDLHVEAGATLAWLPQLVIAAQECRHRTDIRVTLAPGARLLLREEVLFGRHGEHPGRFAQRLRITCENQPLYDQELDIGPGAAGWCGPAITAGHRSAGTLIVIDPGLSGAAHEGMCGDDTSIEDTATMPLYDAGMVVSSLAPDTMTMRRRLDAALTGLTTAAISGDEAAAWEHYRPVRYPEVTNAVLLNYSGTSTAGSTAGVHHG